MLENKEDFRSKIDSNGLESTPINTVLNISPQETNASASGIATRFIIVPLFIIALGLSAWGVWNWRSDSTSSSLPQVADESTPVITPTNTSDLQAYRNEKYGFEFKYPRDWHLATNEISPDSIFLSPQEIIFPSVWGGQLTPIEVYLLSADQLENSLKVWGETKTDYENFAEEPILSSVGEKIGQKFSGVSRSSYDEYSYGLFISEAYLDLKNSNSLVFRYKSNADKPNDNYETYGKILASFQFVEANVSAELTMEQLNKVQYDPFRNPPLQKGIYISQTPVDCSGVHGTCLSGTYVFYYFDPNKIVYSDLDDDGSRDAILVFHFGWLCGYSNCNPDQEELTRQIQSRERGGSSSVESNDLFVVLNANGNPDRVFRFNTFDEIRIPSGRVVALSPLRIANGTIETEMTVAVGIGSESSIQKSIIKLAIDQSQSKIREVRNGSFGPAEWGKVNVAPKIISALPKTISLGSTLVIKGENFRFYQNKVRLTPKDQNLLPRSSCLEVILPSTDDGRTIEVNLLSGVFNTPLECRKDNPLQPAESDLRQIRPGQYDVSVLLESTYPEKVESERVPITIL